MLTKIMSSQVSSPGRWNPVNKLVSCRQAAPHGVANRFGLGVGFGSPRSACESSSATAKEDRLRRTKIPVLNGNLEPSIVAPRQIPLASHILRLLRVNRLLDYFVDNLPMRRKSP
jgi:hypothetical protein